MAPFIPSKQANPCGHLCFSEDYLSYFSVCDLDGKDCGCVKWVEKERRYVIADEEKCKEHRRLAKMREESPYFRLIKSIYWLEVDWVEWRTEHLMKESNENAKEFLDEKEKESEEFLKRYRNGSVL